MHELISPDSAIDPLVTSQLGVCCKRTGVSHLVVKLHSMYKCRLVLRTPYACNPAIDGSVLIVTGRECIVVYGPVSVPHPISINRYIMGTTKGNTTDDLQGSRQIDHQLRRTCLESKPT